MGEKRRYENWDREKCDDGERWPSKSARRWGQKNHARFSTWREEEGFLKPESNGWGDCHPSVPSWVRTFYTSVCRVPWRKICDAKRMMSTYKNVADWDDSAGQEAFENAKTRYWAKINRLPCDLPLPDPYMYIEKVNFDAFIDPELAADLEKSIINPDTDNKATDIVAHETVPTTGWDEAEHSSMNWDKYIEKPTSLQDDEVAQCDPWGSRKNQSIDVNGRDSSWENQLGRNVQDDSRKRQEMWKNIQDKRNSGWNNMNSRYQMGDVQTNTSWKNGNSFQKVQPRRSWHRGELLGSINHRRTGYSGAPWRWENAVS